MSYKTILTQADAGPRTKDVIALACQMALYEQAHLVGLASTGIDELLYQCNAYPPGVPVSDAQLQPLRARADAALAGFDTLAGQLGVAAREPRRIDEALDQGMILQSRYSDLVVLGQDDPDQIARDGRGNLAERVLLHSAKPVLILPYAGRFERVGRHVLVAWDGGIEASRAISAAVPLLRRAGKVTLAVFNPNAIDSKHGPLPGADLASFLARHGVAIEVQQLETELDIGNALLSLAADIDADLLVMGAYGHQRLRELLLGGATRTILKTMTLPVFMAH